MSGVNLAEVLLDEMGLGADAPYGGLCVAYFNGDYPTALDECKSTKSRSNFCR